MLKGGPHLKPPKFKRIFVAIIPFFSFFCANIFDTSLLVIVCALRWYVKSLYRHLFLEDISKHARVTKKWHFLICGRPNSQAPWPMHPKLCMWVAKALSCDIVVLLFSRWTPPPPPPLPWGVVLRRGGIKEIRWCWEESGSKKFGELLWSRLFSTPHL